MDFSFLSIVEYSAYNPNFRPSFWLVQKGPCFGGIDLQLPQNQALPFPLGTPGKLNEAVGVVCGQWQVATKIGNIYKKILGKRIGRKLVAFLGHQTFPIT